METRTTARIDAQELQIQQLQSDVTVIKSTLKLLEEERAEAAEFRKFLLNWMKQYEKNEEAELLESLCGSASVLAQLEAIVFRSEERWRKYEHLTVSSGYSSVRSESDDVPVGQDCSVDHLFSSRSSLPNSLSLFVQSKDIISRSEEISTGHVTLISTLVNGAIPVDEHMKLGSETVMGHGVELNSIVYMDYSVLGPQGEKSYIDELFPFDRGKQLSSSTLLSGSVTNPFVQSQALHPLPKSSLPIMSSCLVIVIDGIHVDETIVGSYDVPASQFWVLHGQPRPPEDAPEKISTWFWSQLVAPSLEDKTV